MLGQAYTALGMELATRYDERTVLTGVESLFAVAGAAFAAGALIGLLAAKAVK